ncbi:MAG: alpha-ketoacid dehydrogenase subunit beta [Chloroflexi bacterium]|nr:alpha-ketoacid dehydrogenase subunit beta [Chloroflexota bacterium]
MPVKTYIEAVREGLRDEMARDPSVVVLGEDIGVQGGVFRATDGLLAAFGEERVIDTPLAESAIVGVAIGMGLNDLRPVAEIQFADFIHSALDQLMSEAAKMRYRSNGGWHCPLVVRVPYGAGVHGGLYHSQSVEALLCHTPGLKVVAPATPYDAKGLLVAAIRDDDPVVFLEHKKAYRLARGEVPEGEYTVPIGSAVVRRQGRHLTVISYGLMLHYVLEAAERLGREGVEAEVVDLRTLAPLDEATVLASVRKTGKALIVHEDNLTLGLGAEVAARIAQMGFEDLDAPVTRMAAPDVPAMPYAPPMEEFCLPDAARIEAAMRQLAAY